MAENFNVNKKIPEPTLDKPTPHGDEFNDNTNATHHQMNVTLDEVDNMLNEKKKSLKKQIWDLAKMESLVHNDPKLSAIYNEMSEDGEEKYGYHYNETIMNIIFNEYVLNSVDYLEKYKSSIPVEKKRRDKAGINQIKDKNDKKKDGDVDESVPTHMNSLSGVKADNPIDELMDNNIKHTGVGDVNNDAEYNQRRINNKYDTLDDVEETTGTMGAAGGSNSGEYTQSLHMKPIYNEKENINEKVSSNDDKLPEEIEKNDNEGEEIDETTTAASSGSYETKHAFANDGKMRHAKKPIYPDGEFVDESYLINPEKFRMIYESLEIDEQKCWDGYYKAGEKMKDGKLVNDCKPVDEGNNDESIVPNALEEHHKHTKEDQIEFICKHSDNNKEDLEDKTSSEIEKIYKKLENKVYKKDVNESIISEQEMNLQTMLIDKIEQLTNGQDLSNYRAEIQFGLLKQAFDAITKDVGINENDMANNNDPYKQIDDLNDKISRIIANKSISTAEQNNEIQVHLEKIGEIMNNIKKPMREYYDDVEMKEILKKMSELSAIGNMKEVERLANKIKEWLDGISESMALGQSDDNTTMKLDTDGTSFSSGSMSSTLNEEGFCPNGMVKNPYKKTDDDNEPKCMYPETLRKREKEENDMKRNSNDHNTMKDAKEKLGGDGESKKETNKYLEKFREKQQQKKAEQKRKSKEKFNKNKEDMNEQFNKELEDMNNMMESIRNISSGEQVSEDRLPSALVLKDRLGKENEKNFKSDIKDSNSTDIAADQDEMRADDNYTEVNDAQELSQEIEKEKMKDHDFESFDNKGNSTNNAGDEIPKRNRTEDEEEDVSEVRRGMQSLRYDGGDGERFHDRMKEDMGDELYDQGQKHVEIYDNMPMYNKDEDNVKDSKKYEKDYENLSEGYMTAKYLDENNQVKFVNFELNEVKTVESIDESFVKLNTDGLGNSYSHKINENVDMKSFMERYETFLKDRKIYAVKKAPQMLAEGEESASPVNENVEKMKKLFNYKPSSYVNTSNIKKNAKF